MTDPLPAAPRFTGGCQCGAVRYALSVRPENLNVCHCRMCQKASGGPFMAFGRVPIDRIEWTRGAPSVFASSSFAVRGFCSACGTPLTFQWKPDAISVTLGSLDDPAPFTPAVQLGIESRLAWLDGLATIPGSTTFTHTTQTAPGSFVNHQHPDRDT